MACRLLAAGRLQIVLTRACWTQGSRAAITLEAAIRDFGLDPGLVNEAAVDENVLGFFEIHIEQGPVLEAEKLSRRGGHRHCGPDAPDHRVRRTGQPCRYHSHALAPRRAGRGRGVDHGRGIAGPATDGLVATVGKIVVDAQCRQRDCGNRANDAGRAPSRTTQCASGAVTEIIEDCKQDCGAPRTGAAGRLAKWTNRRFQWMSG